MPIYVTDAQVLLKTNVLRITDCHWIPHNLIFTCLCAAHWLAGLLMHLVAEKQIPGSVTAL